MKKYAVLQLALFLCACQNVSAGSSAASPGTSSAASSAVSSAPTSSDTEESKYQDETDTLVQTGKYIYIYEKRYASVQDETNPPQFTGTVKRRDKKSGSETVVWQEQNFEVSFFTQYGDDIYFGLDDYREFEWSDGGFMHITDNTNKMIVEDAVNVCAVYNEIIFCGKHLTGKAGTVLQVYSMKEKKFIGVWENILIQYSDSDYEFEFDNGILIWESDDGWHHFDYKTGVDTITKEE